MYVFLCLRAEGTCYVIELFLRFLCFPIIYNIKTGDKGKQNLTVINSYFEFLWVKQSFHNIIQDFFYCYYLIKCNKE